MRRPPAAVFIASLGSLLAGAGLAAAAVGNLILVRTGASMGVAAVAAVVGASAILAGWHLYLGRRPAWLAATVLLPIVGLAVVLDSYAFGTGRLPTAVP